jgi:uncharacterized membrane protein YbhN (UPF0104 family)
MQGAASSHRRDPEAEIRVRREESRGVSPLQEYQDRCVKKLLLLGLKILASGALLWVIFRHIDISQAAAQIRGASMLPLGAALLFSVLVLCLNAWRWQLILEVSGFPRRLPRLLAHTFIGFFFSQATPSTVGGDGVRAWLVYRDGATLSQALRSVLIERLLGLGILVVVAAAGFPWLLARMSSGLALWRAEAAVLGVITIGILSLWLVQRSEWLLRFRIGRGLHALADDIWAILRRPKAAMLFGISSLISQVLSCLTVWAVGNAIGVSLSWATVLIVMPSVFVVAALPISIAGWGLREGAVMVGLGLFGVSATDAVAISVLVGLIYLAVGLAGGVVWLLRGGEISAPGDVRGRPAVPDQLAVQVPITPQSSV